MLSKPAKEFPLVTVIITCYNQGQCLKTAIESVLGQNYESVETIVIDDGSTDNTMQIAKDYPNVKYIYQSNQGLSSARNTGVDCSSGEYIVFLDADDWLLADAISINSKYLKQNHEAAFVSGGYITVNNRGQIIGRRATKVENNHYCHLLQKNYIGMHAAVMYRRWIFETFRFDVLLKACEDYDLFLKVSRKNPISHHTEFIAAYHIHEQNMSGDVPMMLEFVLLVLNRQREFIANSEEEKCFESGLDYWKNYYCTEAFKKLCSAQNSDRNIDPAKELDMLWKFRRFLYLKYFVLKPAMSFKSFIRRNIPDFILRGLHRARIYKDFVPGLGEINMGDLNRVTPFNTVFGYNRGGPVDRYYIENFLRRQAHNIKGRVLEIGDNEYTLQFGGSKVTQSDILHVNEKNSKATFIGDLSNIPQLPADSFDCIVLTQTLHLIYSYREALDTCYRVLKPGGTLLMTVPGISHIDQGEWKEHWFWSFTDNSISRILSEIFPAENVSVESFGNILVATAFLYGIGLPELKKEQIEYNDAHYQVIICASAVKPD